MRATEEHCKFCFDTILAELQNKDVQEPNFDNSEHPVFVTWKASTKLRGCIGSFTPLPLHQGLQKYAKAAAFCDSRFKPIILEEVKGLTCSLSILHSFEDVENILGWTIGEHGLRMQYQNYHAVYLPQVALEQKWSQMDTIRSLLVKSGYKGELTESVIKSMKLVRFKSSIASCTFDSYTGGN